MCNKASEETPQVIQGMPARRTVGASSLSRCAGMMEEVRSRITDLFDLKLMVCFGRRAGPRLAAG